ncbi:MAG: DUF1292 domain-containing protein [Clostridia bacterium]|nr:DUF1292 domain-containing protein [Clostridia bacterium]
MNPNDEELEEFDELDNRIILDDEEGNEIEFEFLDVVEVDGNEYVVLLPVEEAEKGEVVIFRIEGEGDDESYVSLDDEEEAERVFEAFKEKTKDDFDFAD